MGERKVMRVLKNMWKQGLKSNEKLQVNEGIVCLSTPNFFGYNTHN